MLTDNEQAAEAIADFCESENLPDAALVCAMAAGLLAARDNATLDDARVLIDELGRYSGAFTCFGEPEAVPQH